MSYTWLTVRGGGSNPSSLKYQALMNKQSIFENELFKPETTQPKIISAHSEDLVLLQDPFMFRKLQTKTQHYRGGWEPDGVYLRLWARFNHLGKQLKDYAFSTNVSVYPDLPGNVLIPYGKPLLCRGPDDGVKGGTIITKINWDPNSIDYFKVSNPDEGLIGVIEQTQGFSTSFAFILDGNPIQHNGVDPTLWFHVDDPNGDNGTIIRVGTNRELKFFVRDAGTTRNFISANNVVTPGVPHLGTFTYNPTGNILTMKLDDVLMVDSANETPTFPDSIENSVYMGISKDVDDLPCGRFVGKFMDARWYRNLIFWLEHQTNLWNTKRTIGACNLIKYDGNDDIINCGDDSSLWSRPLTKFSFSYWARPDALSDGVYRDMINHGNYAANGFSCYQDISSPEWVFDIFGPISGEKLAVATLTRGALVWYFVLCTYDNSLGSANMKIYIDGKFEASANLTDSINVSADLLLGGDASNFKGNQTDFRFWKSVALTEAQGLAVRDNLPSAPIPDYWLKMNEGNSNPFDWITRTKTGTLTFGAAWDIGATPRPPQFGSLAVAGYSRFNVTVDAGGYDSTGYDSTGFDTT